MLSSIPKTIQEKYFSINIALGTPIQAANITQVDLMDAQSS
jgi:hypothetical protein